MFGYAEKENETKILNMYCGRRINLAQSLRCHLCIFLRTQLTNSLLMGFISSTHSVGAKYYCLNDVLCSGPEAYITE